MSDQEQKTTEEQAREMGWVPESEWVGDPPPNGLLDAGEFVERGEKVLPIIQAQNRKLRTDLDEARKEMGDIKATAQKFREYNKTALNRERKEKAELLKTLEVERADAITEGDGPKAVETEAKIAELRTEQAKPDPVIEKDVDDWLQRNPWFNENKDMRSWADGRAFEHSRRGVEPGLPTLVAIEKELEEAQKPGGIFELMVSPDRKTTSTVEGNVRRRAPASDSHSFEDLPAEAKRDFKDFQKDMPDYTKKEFLEMYEWE